MPEHDIAAHGAATQAAFQSIFSAAGWTSAEYFAKLDSIRRKLSSQLIPEKGWLVFMGAGGDYVCAACAPASTYRIGKTIIDQTLYWAAVPTEDEALYLVGLLNSEALNLVIKDFQPRGQFGARHVHKLPLGVTPPFNPDDAAHADVVARTRTLLTEWRAMLLVDPIAAALLLPTKRLPPPANAANKAYRASWVCSL